MLLNLRKFLVPEIVYGAGAITLAGRHAMGYGASRVLLVTDPGVQKAGWTGKVEASLDAAGVGYMTFNRLTPNPKDHEVMDGVSVYREGGCDLILAVGGGSPMDCAKGIGVVAGNGGHILDYEGVDQVPEPGPPLIFIPTTAGSSADVSQFAIVTDTERKIKIAIVSKMVVPEISLVDPETCLSMAPELTAETGMDALCHAFEAYVSKAASPLTDMAAIRTVELVSGHLHAAFSRPDDMAAREKMMTASLSAGIAFSNASLGLVHAMAHSLGGRMGIAHGLCNAILLEKVAAYNFPSAPERYRRLARAMGVAVEDRNDHQVSEDLTGAIRALRRQLGIRIRLSQLGVTEAELETLSESASRDACLATNPRDASTDQIRQIFKQIL